MNAVQTLNHRVASGLALSSSASKQVPACKLHQRARRAPLVLPQRRGLPTSTRALGDPTIGSAQLASMSVVIASTVITGMYWWLVVVPSERATLAKSKRRGTMRQYLQDIQNDPSRQAERWFYADWLRQLEAREGKKATGQQAGQPPNAAATKESSMQGNSAASTSTSMQANSAATTTTTTATAMEQGSAAAPQASTAASESSPVPDLAQPLAQAQQAQPQLQQQSQPQLQQQVQQLQQQVQELQQQPQQQLQQSPQQPPQPQPDANRVSRNLLEPTERTPEPRFVSLDNPVILTATLLGVLVFLSAMFH